MKNLLAISGALLLAFSTQPEPSPSVTRAQAAKASRFSPREFPGLPVQIADDLESRGCSIPQSYIGPKPHNAIQGRFHRPGQTDCAILCSRNGESSILVYSGCSAGKVEEVGGGWKELLNFETLDHGDLLVGFHRKIVPVGAPFITEHYEFYGCGPKPPPIDHEGINDAYVEKASVVHYWHAGEWLKLPGAD